MLRCSHHRHAILWLPTAWVLPDSETRHSSPVLPTTGSTGRDDRIAKGLPAAEGAQDSIGWRHLTLSGLRQAGTLAAAGSPNGNGFPKNLKGWLRGPDPGAKGPGSRQRAAASIAREGPRKPYPPIPARGTPRSRASARPPAPPAQSLRSLPTAPRPTRRPRTTPRPRSRPVSGPIVPSREPLDLMASPRWTGGPMTHGPFGGHLETSCRLPALALHRALRQRLNC